MARLSQHTSKTWHCVKWCGLWVLLAPWMKTKPSGDWICYMDSGCPCSPAIAVDMHLQLNSNIPLTVPLFAFMTSISAWASMTRSWFMARCNEIWSATSLPHLTGHSFRIGRTTHLLLLGVNPFVIMVQGRWKSDAFLAYWHHCEQILPLFIGSALNPKADIVTAMHTFRLNLLKHT